MKLYRDTLWWSMSLALVPDQNLSVLNPESINTEEFCWEGVRPTPEAERQIWAHAAEEGREHREHLDVTPEQLRQFLMSKWTMRHPVHELNKYLLTENMLGEYGFMLKYGH